MPIQRALAFKLPPFSVISFKIGMRPLWVASAPRISSSAECHSTPQHSTGLHGTPRDWRFHADGASMAQHGTAWHSMAQRRQLSGTVELQAFCKSVAPSASLSFTLIPCSVFNVFFNVQRLCCPLKHLKDSPQKHTQI